MFPDRDTQRWIDGGRVWAFVEYPRWSIILFEVVVASHLVIAIVITRVINNELPRNLL